MRSARELGGTGRMAVVLAAACVGSAGGGVLPDRAEAAVTHVVQPGETLWSISAANNFTTRTVAAFNGLSEDAAVYAGQSLEIPSVAEGEAALASAAPPPAGAAVTEPVAAEPALDAATGLATVSGPLGSVPLDPAAAVSFEQMRADALANYGVDLYPDGTLSGYRSYEQQAYLYDLFLAGQGAPANPPGSSSHELGIAIDLAEPAMRDVVDQIGAAYGWYGIQSEWWHIQYGG